MCRAGGLAARLLAAELPPGATYFGVDQSSTMTELTQARLQKFGGLLCVSPIWCSCLFAMHCQVPGRASLDRL